MKRAKKLTYDQMIKKYLRKHKITRVSAISKTLDVIRTNDSTPITGTML